MRMKNVLSLILALVLVLGLLAGCGSNVDDIRGTVTSDKTAQAAPEEATQAAEEDRPVSLGRMEGGTYTNKYAGFGCTLDSSWEYYTAEELQELPSQTAEIFEDSEVGEAMQKLEQIADMKAESVEELASINILYQKMSTQERLTYAVMTEEQILDATLAQKDMLMEAYAQGGIDVSEMTKETVTFLGEERTALRTVAKMDGIDYYILQVFDYHLGEYAVTLTLGSFVEDKTDSLLELWYKVD